LDWRSGPELRNRRCVMSKWLPGKRTFDAVKLKKLQIPSSGKRLAAAAVLVMLIASGPLQSADAFKPFALRTIDGIPRELKDYLNKVTLVTFFFPTCGSCNAEFPRLQKIYDKYREQGFSIVTINIVPDQESLIAEWQEKYRYTFPVLIGASLEHLQKAYDLQRTPTHFLLNAQGKVILKQSGYVAGDEMTLEDKIQKTLNP
jgi:thiol-disulfide isomerase/thioredoxin